MGPRPNDDGRNGTAPRDHPVPRGPLRLLTRTLSRAWDHNIFSESAEAAFWTTLSLPPLLLGLLGSLGFVGDWFGPDLVHAVQSKILGFTRTVFTPDVVDRIIAPTVSDILTQGRGEVVSVGFVLSLWAGSSAMASFVDAITVAYGQYDVRNVVWQRIVALLMYLVSLVAAVLVLPLIALGPDLLPKVFPTTWQQTVAGLVDKFYYPATGVLLVLALTTLYKIALPRKLPWHRGMPGALLAMVVFLLTSSGLRLYLIWVTGTGYTYGALATPIAFLLFAFFIGFAIVLGAHFNNTIQEMWPARMTRRERRRWRRLEMERAAERLRRERDEPPGRPTQNPVHGPEEATSPADTHDTKPIPRDSAPPGKHVD
ncbi:hypothetical protein GCM10012275_27490 [Longimycelium tulufanense]|uniref:Uncharacterized protein n=1 Tax=Longimycelium tulufanense TaxID=907463 RepID=A0A8J3C8A8_9PSEU|nr:YihY/virulence factor BrkB family protein [Longimycelium tulufanense]GGM54889.1 hypothetical protein GCM10012275_27490 [Longimycelium tulufanense]